MPPASRAADSTARSVRRAGIAAAAAGALAAAVAACLVLVPVEDAPRRADAIVVLGGLGARPVIDEAVRLMDAGYADRVVVSDAFGGDTLPAHLCRTYPARFECVEPDPATTAGEARLIGQMADERGWDALLVVTRTYHVTRARMILDRCIAGELMVTGVDGELSVADRLHQVVYQSAATVVALARPGCGDTTERDEG